MVSVGDSSSFRGGEFIGLLLSGYRAYFGGQWKAGEWSRSVLLAAVPVVAGRSGSKVTGARGASPADGLPAVASSRAFAVSVSCGSLQSFAATGFRRAMDSRRLIPAVAGDARRRQSRIHRGSRGLVVIFMFSRGLCVKRMVEQVYSVSYLCLHVCVCVWVFVPYISL